MFPAVLISSFPSGCARLLKCCHIFWAKLKQWYFTWRDAVCRVMLRCVWRAGGRRRRAGWRCWWRWTVSSAGAPSAVRIGALMKPWWCVDSSASASLPEPIRYVMLTLYYICTSQNSWWRSIYLLLQWCCTRMFTRRRTFGGKNIS